MTTREVQRLLGDIPDHIAEGLDGLVDAANADSGEGVEWLPRYKLALSLLANAIGMASGALTKLATAFDRQPAGVTIRRIHSEISDLWEAHLRCIGEEMVPPATSPTVLYAASGMLAEACETTNLLALLQHIGGGSCQCDPEVGAAPCESCVASLGFQRITTALAVYRKAVQP